MCAGSRYERDNGSVEPTSRAAAGVEALNSFSDPQGVVANLWRQGLAASVKRRLPPRFAEL